MRGECWEADGSRQNMPGHDIVVVGASAGGVEALCTLVSRLPPNLRASVFVVLHLSAGAHSQLASVLSRCGPLPTHEAATGETFQPGHVYVAPPDYHLLLEDNHMHLWRGPKENRQRPSVNVLFRSAAVGYGPRVAGAILSGTLDDGAAGLWWIKRYGGVAIVQDPADTIFPDMIYSALEHVEVDHIVRIASMGELLASVVDGGTNQTQAGGVIRAGAAGGEWKPDES